MVKRKANNKKSHEEYVNEVSIINPNVEVVGKYIGAKTKILHRCKICGHEWMVSPDGILCKRGCPECANKRRAENSRMTHEEYVSRLNSLNSNIISIEKYINSTTPILHKCLIDGYEWMLSPNNSLKGKGCPKCAGNIKLTHDEYLKRLSDIGSCIIPLEKYKDIFTPILHRCLVHNIKYSPTPKNVLNGNGCSECKKDKISFSKLRTNEEYSKELKKANKNVIVLENYIDNKTPILHKCLIHNINWRITPSNALKGNGCPKCHRERIAYSNQKTNDEYVAELFRINPEVVVLEEYLGNGVPITHKCLRHNFEWLIAPVYALRGYGCPMCRESFGEKKIRQWLELNSVKYIYQYIFIDCKDVNPLPFDFYLPELNICIEYDGIQHFEPTDFSGKGKEWAEKQLEYTQKHDKIKTGYCKNNNIELLRISYLENVEEKLNNFLFI